MCIAGKATSYRNSRTMQGKCCDLCPGRMKGTTMYGCGMCNFGMCQRCYEGKADSDVGTGPLGRGLNEVRRNNRFYDIGAHSGMFIAPVRLGIMCHCDRNGIIKMQTPPTSSLKSREMRPDEAANVVFHLLDTTRQQVQYFVIFGCNTGGLDGCVTIQIILQQLCLRNSQWQKSGHLWRSFMHNMEMHKWQ